MSGEMDQSHGQKLNTILAGNSQKVWDMLHPFQCNILKQQHAMCELGQKLFGFLKIV